MKKSLLLIAVVSLLFTSCVGPIGPPGPPGPPGEGLLPQIFEAQVSFTSQNEYTVLVQIPQSIVVYASDIVMAYKLVGSDNNVDIWEPLPQTLFLDGDTLLYGFDHTLYDVEFFMDATFPLDLLGPDYTRDVVFRVAVIPAESAKNLDVNNFSDVFNSMQDKEMVIVN